MKKLINKYFDSSEKALISKDIMYLWNDITSKILLISIPVVLIFILPISYLIFSLGIENTTTTVDFSQFVPTKYQSYSSSQILFYMFTNYVSPMMYILVPVLTAAFSTILCFNKEKEDGTFFTLMLSNLSLRKTVKDKLFISIINSAIISLVSIVVLSIILITGDVYFKIGIFTSYVWIILILLVSPAITLLSCAISYFLSIKFKKNIQGIVSTSYIAIPVILLFLGQLMRLYTISWLFSLILFILISIADIILYYFIFKTIKISNFVKIQ
jgi:hypothetical protein